MNSFVQNTSNQEQAIKRFLRDYLNKPENGQTIHTILSGTCRYYDADRTYIFELNESGTTVSNTYEWCREGISSGMGELQNIPVDSLGGWFQALEEQGEFYISSLSDSIPHDSETYRTFDRQGVRSLAVAPLIVNGSVVGLLGADNPRRNDSHLLLLSVIASACCSEIVNKRLENSNKALTERMKIIQSMSEIYTSVYYIDILNDRYTELSSVDIVHEHIGSSGNAQESLDFFCRNMATPEYTDKLLKFVDISTLNERIKQERIISKQFLCTVPLPDEQPAVPYWAQCSFIEGDRTSDGRLSHVIFVTQTIHKSKVKELETQKYLQKTNAELTELLAAEKQHTAIIGSLSNVFFALYYIDFEDNSLQEIFSPSSKYLNYGKKDNAKKRLSSMVDSWVNDEYKAAMRIFTDTDTLDGRLGDKPIITQEYEDINGSWIRCCFFPVEKNEIGKNVKVICGFRRITAEKERQESQYNLIQALSMTYENVYAVNMDTSEAVCYRMGKVMIDRYGQKFAVSSYEPSLRLYVEREVLAEDKHLFDRILIINDVKALLSDRQTYSFIYRVSRNDAIEYFECQLVKPKSDRNEFAVGFKNVSDEKKQELAQQKKIEALLQQWKR